METLLLLMVLPPLAGSAVNGIWGRRFPNRLVTVIGCGAAALSMVFALWAAWDYTHGGGQATAFEHSYFTWMQAGAFQSDYAFYYDRLTLVMSCTVTVAAFLIHIYSGGYMEHEGGYYRFFCYLNLFLFMMLTLVTASNYPLMFVGWEGVGLCSYLLIGFYFTKKSAADAGKKAFITTRIGDVGFTLATVLLFWTFHSVNFRAVFARIGDAAYPASADVLTAIGILFFVGAAGKSAQLPLYVWLPDAMEGPTPVSALIHAATMVTAGVYLVARSNPVYAHAPDALHVVGIVGCLTAFFAATMALVQNDLKRILAYSTMSQLGYMFLGCGAGVFASGIFHLMTHAFFKALLFLTAGSVMHAMSGELDIRKMGGLRHKIPLTFATFFVGTLAISGMPGLAGFFSKDEILEAAYEGPLGAPWMYALATVTAGMTAFYMFRALFMTFFGKSRIDPQVEEHVHESGRKMTVPLMILALLSITAGWISIPKPLGGSAMFDQFLAPLFEHSESFLQPVAAAVEAHGHIGLALMLISLGAALVGFLIAYWFYLLSPGTPERLSRSFSGLYNLLVHKWYVDEVYDTIFIQPVRLASEYMLWKAIDAGLIDGGLVTGAAESAVAAGGVLRRMQSGNLRSYAVWVLLGAVAWLCYAMAR